MRLLVLLPNEIFMDETVDKVIAEARNGSFCLLPRHVDFVAALVPGPLAFETAEGREVFLAIDEGILVKCGHDVSVSTRNAARGPDLGQLKETVTQQFKNLDDREKRTRVAMAKIEAGFVRRFLEMKDQG